MNAARIGLYVVTAVAGVAAIVFGIASQDVVVQAVTIVFGALSTGSGGAALRHFTPKTKEVVTTAGDVLEAVQAITDRMPVPDEQQDERKPDGGATTRGARADSLAEQRAAWERHAAGS